MSEANRQIPRIFDRDLLRGRRQRAATRQGVADRADFLLAWVRDDLADRLALIKRAFPRVLDLGAHTGLVGDMLRRRPGTELVVEMDHSEAMLALCSGTGVVADEEALPFGDDAFDLVVSPLSLQHVNDLPGALVQIRRCLKPDGLFLGALLGGRTLHELRAVLTDAELEVCGGVSPRVAPFADVRDLGALLQRAGFALPVTDADTVSVSYATLFDLVRDLRGMGATNMLADRRREMVPRRLFLRAAELYAERFSGPDGRLIVSFDIVTLTAWAPDASQPKPLAPGTAQKRLADVLGTVETPIARTEES